MRLIINRDIFSCGVGNPSVRDKMKNAGDKLLNVQEVAARLGVKPGWVYRHSRALGAFHLGKYVRFDWPTLLDNLRKFKLGNEPNDGVQAQG